MASLALEIPKTRVLSLPLPWWLREGGGKVGKESACNAGDLGLIPELGRSPGGGHGNPLQYSCLENPQGQRSLAGYSPWGGKESDTTEWPSTQSLPPPPTYSLPVASDPSGSRVWPNSQLKVGVGSFSAGLPLNPIRGKALGRIRPSGAQSPKGRALTRV